MTEARCDGTLYNRATKGGIHEMKTKRPYVIGTLLAIHVLTDAGVSATTTTGVLRAQPYSID